MLYLETAGMSAIVATPVFDSGLLVVLVAEKIVNVQHQYLGSHVEIHLWSPLDDVDNLTTASHSTALDSKTTVNSGPAYPVVYCVKKQSAADPVQTSQTTESLHDSSTVDNDESRSYLEQKLSVDTCDSRTDVQAVPARSTPRQLVSSLTSDVVDCRLKYLPITGENETQFHLLKQVLEGGMAAEHQCSFTTDENERTITLSSKSEECINLLAEQLYRYKSDGTYEVELDMLPELAKVLYSKHRQWLHDRFHGRLSDPAALVMSSNGRLAVVAFSKKTAVEGAKKLGACLLRGKVPLADSQQKLLGSSKFSKKLRDIMTNKTVHVRTSAREIIVDGLPRDVVCAVSEIDQCLYKQ